MDNNKVISNTYTKESNDKVDKIIEMEVSKFLQAVRKDDEIQ